MGVKSIFLLERKERRIMKKQGCCMKGQIDLFTWYDREERAEKKLYRKVSKWQSVMPFRLLVFHYSSLLSFQ